MHIDRIRLDGMSRRIFLEMRNEDEEDEQNPDRRKKLSHEDGSERAGAYSGRVWVNQSV